jgi:hypothetical protein
MSDNGWIKGENESQKSNLEQILAFENEPQNFVKRIDADTADGDLEDVDKDGIAMVDPLCES